MIIFPPVFSRNKMFSFFSQIIAGINIDVTHSAVLSGTGPKDLKSQLCPTVPVDELNEEIPYFFSEIRLLLIRLFRRKFRCFRWAKGTSPYSFSTVTVLSCLMSNGSEFRGANAAPATAPLHRLPHILYCKRCERYRRPTGPIFLNLA